VARTKQPKQAVVIGQLAGIDDAYPREVPVPRYLVLGMLWIGALFRAVLFAFRGRGGGRRWKDLRKGPEYLVTPVRVRDVRGRLVELEIHGYLSVNALRAGDQVRARVRRQGDEDLPPRVYHLANLTTGQVFEPRAPTLWSHLGPDVVLQAGLGLLLALVAGACLWGVLG
jgi:hypothetical protein